MTMPVWGVVSPSGPTTLRSKRSSPKVSTESRQVPSPVGVLVTRIRAVVDVWRYSPAAPMKSVGEVESR